jgi:DNA polymerase-3 subunit delta
MPPTKAKKTSSIFAVLGSDEASVKERALRLAAKLAPPDGGEFGVERIDGAVDNADQAIQKIHSAIEAIQTLPFFGDAKLVWFKDVNFLADTVTGRAASVLAALEEFKDFLSQGLPPGVVLLLSAGAVDKRRAFPKALAKLGQLEQFDVIDTTRSGWEEEVEGLTLNLAHGFELKFDREALELFVRLAGADTRQLRNELTKIDLYLGPDDRHVTEAVVTALVAKSTSGVIWELGTAVTKRRLPEALRLLDELLFQGETAIGILFAAIIPTVRNLLAVKELFERTKVKPPQLPFQFSTIVNKLPPEATAFLPRKKDGTINAYGLGLAACEAHRFSLSELVEGLNACLQTNLQLVTTQLDPRLLLSELLVKLLVPTP